jgi:hypothetical protein
VQLVGEVGSARLWRFRTRADARRVYPSHNLPEAPGLWLFLFGGLGVPVTPSLAAGLLIKCKGLLTSRAERVLRGAARDA